MVERMKRKIVRTLKASLNEGRCPLVDWVEVVPVVQWALNAAYCERCQACSLKVVLARKPGIPVMTVLESSEDENKVERLDQTQVQAELGELVRTQDKLYKEVLKWVTANHVQKRVSASEGTLPSSEVGDYVKVARVLCQSWSARG